MASTGTEPGASFPGTHKLQGRAPRSISTYGKKGMSLRSGPTMYADHVRSEYPYLVLPVDISYELIESIVTYIKSHLELPCGHLCYKERSKLYTEWCGKMYQSHIAVT